MSLDTIIKHFKSLFFHSDECWSVFRVFYVVFEFFLWWRIAICTQFSFLGVENVREAWKNLIILLMTLCHFIYFFIRVENLLHCLDTLWWIDSIGSDFTFMKYLNGLFHLHFRMFEDNWRRYWKCDIWMDDMSSNLIIILRFKFVLNLFYQIKVTITVYQLRSYLSPPETPFLNDPQKN